MTQRIYLCVACGERLEGADNALRHNRKGLHELRGFTLEPNNTVTPLRAWTVDCSQSCRAGGAPFHIVTEPETGLFGCDCPGYQHRPPCRHVKAVKEYLAEPTVPAPVVGSMATVEPSGAAPTPIREIRGAARMGTVVRHPVLDELPQGQIIDRLIQSGQRLLEDDSDPNLTVARMKQNYAALSAQMEFQKRARTEQLTRNHRREP